MPPPRPPAGSNLPYWDSYLRQLAAAELPSDVRALHSHYGCWDNPSWSNRVPEDYGRAAERMCDKAIQAAGIADGQRVLDVGCGLGATIQRLNQQYGRMELFGLNIDSRQLAIARQVCQPRVDNQVRLIQGDAVRLPLAASAFDVVLALECSMHFASRTQFLAEAARVLRPGGRLALCEHFSASPRPEPQDRPRNSRLWGLFQEPLSAAQYRSLAAQQGFRAAHDEDVTAETVPTFPGVRKFIARGMRWPLSWQARLMLHFTEWLVRHGRLQYRLLAFER